MVERASAHAQKGELAAAHALYTQLLTIDPAHAEAISFVAIAALQTGEAQRSVELLKRGIAANPGDAMLRKNLGLAYRASGDMQAALAAFADALRLKPDFVTAALNQAALLAELGRAEEALSVYLRAFEAADVSGQFLNLSAIPPGIRVLAEKGFALLREIGRASCRERVYI